MKELSRRSLYGMALAEDSFFGDYDLLIRYNILLLQNIEELFLADENGSVDVSLSVDEIVNQINENISQIRQNEDLMNYISIQKNVETVEQKIRSIVEKRTSRLTAKHIFNQLINSLAEINKREMSRNELPEMMSENITLYPQVFLSHAYLDRLYTYALFIYFYSFGIYLYVDWMHHDEYTDGRDLKRDLKEQLDKSEQLLFMRTLNSELDIEGKHMIRSWCAWEMGNFYSITGNEEKYLINLYSVDKYDNLQLHGLKLLTEIERGRMKGNEISPLI